MKIAIVGTGRIGTTTAYTLFLRGVVSEIALVNRNRTKAYAEALDMTHGLAAIGRSIRIYSGDFRACAGAALVIVTAGVPTQKGQSRLEIVRDNAVLFGKMIPEIVRYNPDGIILVVTNPVDVTTYLALRYSGLPTERVIGSGTVLDGQRFRSLLGRHYNVNPANVQAMIMGEHGDSMFPVWSQASISGLPLDSFPEYDPEEMSDIFDMARRGAAMVRGSKESTEYATSLAVERIANAILLDRKEVLTVSTLLDGYYGISDVCLSVPAVVGAAGIERRLDLPLAEEEQQRLANSADILKRVLSTVRETPELVP